LETLRFYVKLIMLTKGMLNARALHELDEGSLYVSTSFINVVLEKLRLPLLPHEIDDLLNKLNSLVEDNFIYYDDFMNCMCEVHHKHYELPLKRKKAHSRENLIINHDNTYVNAAMASEAVNTPNQPSEQPNNAPADVPKSSSSAIQANAPLSLSEFKNLMKNFFGTVYSIKDRSSGTNFISRAENVTKQELIEMLTMATPNIFQAASILSTDRKAVIINRLNTQVKNQIELKSIDEVLAEYREVVIALLKEIGEEKNLIFAIMISKLMK